MGTISTYNNDISLNYPSSDIEYHKYNGNFIPISWEAEAGTVYGGTLNVISGKLTVTRVNKVFNGTENLYVYSETPARGYVMYEIGVKNTFITNSGISNMLQAVSSGIISSNWSHHVQNSNAYNRDQIAIRFDESFYANTNSGFANNYLAEMARLYAAGTPLEVTYELATPIEY